MKLYSQPIKYNAWLADAPASAAVGDAGSAKTTTLPAKTKNIKQHIQE